MPPSPSPAAPAAANRAAVPRGDIATPARGLGRRASLPGGRAIVGGLLVTVAAVATFAAFTAANAGPSHHLLVVTTPIRPGQVLRASDVRLVAADVPDEVRDQSFDAMSDLDGAVALAPMQPDEVITRSAVRQAGRASDGASLREFSFALERERVLDGRLQRGELVDLVATYGSGTDAYTTVVAHQVRVLDASASGTGTVGSNGKITLTIGLESDHHVLVATHALEIAKVNVVRAAPPDEPRGDPGPSTPPGPDRYQPPMAEPPVRDAPSPGTAKSPATTGGGA